MYLNKAINSYKSTTTAYTGAAMNQDGTAPAPGLVDPLDKPEHSRRVLRGVEVLK